MSVNIAVFSVPIVLDPEDAILIFCVEPSLLQDQQSRPLRLLLVQTFLTLR